MNMKRIKELVELMNINGLTEIEVEQEGLKIRLIKRPYGAVEQVISPVPQAKEPLPAKEAAGEPLEEQKNLREVKSPMVGTFYRAPSPDTDSYVDVGDVVKKGDVLCIVEAMKLMNEVKAEFGGKIVEIVAENAEPVEYGQPLFMIETV
ncbi:MAG: acetyl-CoA carboxylase biotin carboxyl carrier protein [Candidatus Omnitrophota bacterium]|nr:acetyl-CoA carboxylase biotin carboxyl carrier protein [Candidatus Omnitrophota bacterium]